MPAPVSVSRVHGLTPPLRIRAVALFVLGACACLLAGRAWANSIDVDFLRKPWPKEHKRQIEIGRTPAQWRQYASRRDGIFAGVRFQAPFPRQLVWDRASDYSDVGKMTPGVRAVRFVEKSPTRQVIQVDIQVLWKKLTLTFEVEQEPPQLMKFRLVNRVLGEYRGLSLFTEAVGPDGTAATQVELSTWLKTARPVPAGLLLAVERMALLQGAEQFLKDLERSNK